MREGPSLNFGPLVPQQNLGRGQPLPMGSMAGEISRMKPAADKEESRCRTKMTAEEKRERHPDRFAGELSGERIHLLLCCCCCCCCCCCAVAR